MNITLKKKLESIQFSSQSFSLSRHLLSINLRIKLHKGIIVPFVCIGVTNWSRQFKKEHQLKANTTTYWDVTQRSLVASYLRNIHNFRSY
jgi:hypothetical protein